MTAHPRRAITRRVLALLLITLSALPAGAETVTRNTGTHTFTTSDALVTVLDGPSDTHAATLDTRLYVPDNATAAHPQPAILMTNGFGLNKLSGEVVSMATFLARHGYVVLTYTAQGFGKSTGCITLQSRTYDVKDAMQLITKVLEPKAFVKKDARGPLVGTVGGSYGGGIQANLAERDPRIRAIVPSRTWNDLQYSLDPNNYVVPGDPTGFSHALSHQGVFKLEWTSLFFASGAAGPIGGLPPNGQQQGTCPQDKLTTGDYAGTVCTGYHLPLCETYAKLAATGDLDAAGKALVADSSATTEMTKLRVPTLLTQGQSDTLFNLNDAVATYTALKRQGVPVQMIWNSGGHGGYDSLPGECEVYGRGTGGAGYRGLDDCYLTLRTLAFFDHWLKGKPDHSPGFTWYQDWVPYKGSGPSNQYGSAPAFPAGTPTTLTLSGTNALVRTAATSASVNLLNPAGGLPSGYTETSNFSGPDSNPNLAQPPTDVPGQAAAFTGPAFATPTDVVGVPTLRVKLSHVAPTDLIVFGKVFDVAPGGTATLVHRLLAPARIPSSALSRPVTIKLLGFAHRFDKGHRLRLDLATTDLTSYNNKVPDVITVTTGAGSTLTFNTLRPTASDVAHPASRPPVRSGGRPLPSTGLSVAVPLVALVLIGGALYLRRRR
ncbi:MAG: CocE/NonD family hydrolase [Mycobacteriales bacterium]